MMKNRLLCLAAAACFLFAFAAIGQERGQGRANQTFTERYGQQLNLTDAQKQQISALVKDAMTAEHADMKQFHANLGQLKTLLTAADIDEAAVAKLHGAQDQLLLATTQRVTDTLVQAAKFDPELSRVYLRHVRYQRIYPARASVTAPPPRVRPSVPTVREIKR